jgi:hypothetical protein
MSAKKRINRPIFFILSGAALLTPVVSGAATTVTVQDSGGVPTSCGNLVNLTTTPGQVTIETDGTCIGTGGGGTPVAQTINDIDVSDGGASTTIDVSTYGVSVKLPFSVVGVTQPALGSVSAPTGTSFTYTAPDTVTGTQYTSFKYTIQDATDGQAEGVVEVAITHADNPPPPTGNCTPTTTLHCKGPISLTSVTKMNNSLSYGYMDVWEFTYNDSRKGWFTHDHGNQKVAIISASPDESMTNPVDSRCVADPWNTEATFVFNRTDLASAWECPLVNGQTYYLKFKLKVQGTSDANYYLSTTSNPQ